MMLRLCFLLMNVRNLSTILTMDVEPHHTAWMEEGFDYRTDKKQVLDESQVATVQNKLESGTQLMQLQEAFLGMDISDEDEEL
jgi:hypothetical protein